MLNFDPTYYPNPAVLLQLETGFKPTTPRAWGRESKDIYKRRCLITRELIIDKDLVAHHCYSKGSYPKLQYSLLNAVCLRHDIHKNLHLRCGLQTTLPQLIQYVYVFQKENTILKKSDSLEIIEWLQFLESELKSRYF